MPSYKNLSDVFQGGATTSQHVEARDESHFKDTTFLLKRTRSLGLLDDYIIPNEAKEKESFITEETVNKINNNGKPTKPCHILPKINTKPHHQQTAPKYSILYDSDDSDHEPDHAADHESQQNTPLHHQHESSPSAVEASIPLSPEFLPHDDNNLLYEPQRHVDYLSHDWKESDISKSWRYIVLRRKDVANSARLENASWRTWAQLKNHLKTVSPESVNWLKESDVTWLYGPLYREPPHLTGEISQKKENTVPAGSGDSSSSATPASIDTSCDPVPAKGPKPILKKRTAAEMMLSQLEFMRLSLLQSHHKQWNPHTGSPILELIGGHHHDRTLSPVSLNSPLMQHKDASESVSSQRSVSAAPSSESKKQNRHIHFNETVKQCIAVDVPESDDEAETSALGNRNRISNDDDESSDDESSSDDEGGFCLKVRSPSSAFLYQQGMMKPAVSQQQDLKLPPMSRAESNSSSSSACRHPIIQALPPTNLNYNSTEDECEDSNDELNSDGESEKVYTSVPFYDNRVSHNVHTSRNYDYHYNYDYNSIYPSSEVIINDKKNDDLQVYDIPEDLDLGSTLQLEDVAPSGSVSSSNNSSLTRTSSGYNIKEQQPLPPYQSNDSASGKLFQLDHSDDDSDQEDNNINQRLQRISSREREQQLLQKDVQHHSTKDLANVFLGNWKK